MPVTHTRTFRVRYYECDAYGHVNNSNYLRYMQEAAFDASKAVGYDLEKYEELGQIWLIRDTEVEFLRPVLYGDSVEVKTWVEDFRRVRSIRKYEFRANGSEELMGRGQTDWVYLDSETHKPVSIPEEMKTAFFPEGPPEKAPRREPYPEPPTAPPGALTFTRKVAWNDVDPTQHVHNAQYFTYIEEAGIQVGEAFGWPIQRILDDGYAWVIRKAGIESRLQARMGDELTITTYLSDVRRASVIRNYFIRQADNQELVARAYLQWAMVDLTTGRPIRLPAQIMEDFAPNIAGEAG
jgi:acyl-CoA thioester hydrolase